MSCSEEKKGFADYECFAPTEKEPNLNHRIITCHAETCKQVIIMKRIKKQTNKKTSTIIFLKKKCYLHFFIEIVVNQNVILDIFRHVELTNDIVCRIEGFRG